MPSWGNRITISIYVEDADQEWAVKAAQGIAQAAEAKARAYYLKPPDFVGASVEPVETKPQDQGAS